MPGPDHLAVSSFLLVRRRKLALESRHLAAFPLGFSPLQCVKDVGHGIRWGVGQRLASRLGRDQPGLVNATGEVDLHEGDGPGHAGCVHTL